MTTTTTNNRLALDIADLIGPNFHKVHQDVFVDKGNYDELWLKGGRGSTKSSFASIECVLCLFEDPQANVMCIRKVKDTLRKSVYPQILWAIEQLHLNHHFDFYLSPMRIVRRATGQRIDFDGLDDPKRKKGTKVTKGYYKIAWFEEAEEYSGIQEVRSVMQTLFRGGANEVAILTYNPPNDPRAWVNSEADREVARRYVHHSTYKTVPPSWLGEFFIRAAKRLRKTEPEAYQHEYMGQAVGRSAQIVFSGKWEEADFDVPPGVVFYYGCDWGYAQDPTVLVRVFIHQGNLYIDDCVHGVGVELDHIPAMFDRMEKSRSYKIRADSARPETISYVRRKGFNISAAPKWQGSVEDGIEFIRGRFHRIFVRPHLKFVIDELSLYSYKVDPKTQDILPDVVDKNNHSIDAIRYALAPLIKGKVSLEELLYGIEENEEPEDGFYKHDVP